jgi:hypothetical protein
MVALLKITHFYAGKFHFFCGKISTSLIIFNAIFLPVVVKEKELQGLICINNLELI